MKIAKRNIQQDKAVFSFQRSRKNREKFRGSGRSERFPKILATSLPGSSPLRVSFKMAVNKHELYVLFITLYVAKVPDRLIPLSLSLFSRLLHELGTWRTNSHFLIALSLQQSRASGNLRKNLVQSMFRSFPLPPSGFRPLLTERQSHRER